MLYDPLTVSIRGDPSSDDVGRWSVQVEAIGSSSEHTAKDVFTIHVVDASECVNVFMALTLDADAKTVSSAKQVFLKRYVARLLHISPLDVEMRASVQVDQPTDWIRAGLGNSIRASHPLVVQLTARLPCNVNDNQSFWKEWNEISSNGHLAKKLTFPILGWFLTSTRQTSRDKRAIEGSGEDDYDDGDYDYSNVDGEDYASAKVEPQSRTVPDLVSPVVQVQPCFLLINFLNLTIFSCIFYEASTSGVGDASFATRTGACTSSDDADIIDRHPTDSITNSFRRRTDSGRNHPIFRSSFVNGRRVELDGNNRTDPRRHVHIAQSQSARRYRQERQ